MNKAEVRKALVLETEQYFRERNFKFATVREAYCRRLSAREERYYLRLVSSGHDWLVEPSVAIRFQQLEEIYHRTSRVPSTMQAEYAALWVALDVLSGRPRTECVPRVSALADVPRVARHLESLFGQFGSPYLDTHQSIEDVDRLLNSDPTSASIHRSPPYRSAYGLIAAALLHRADFDSLVEAHRHAVSRLDRGFHLRWFDELVTDLRKNYLNA